VGASLSASPSPPMLQLSLLLSLPDDFWTEILQYLSAQDLARLFSSCTYARYVAGPREMRPRLSSFDTQKPISPAIVSAACYMESLRAREPAWKLSILQRLLDVDMYVYARSVDEHGNKVNDRLRLYKVRLLNFTSSSYRYGYARVAGEYNASDVKLRRVFGVPVPGSESGSGDKRQAEDVSDDETDSGEFDDDGALAQLCNLNDLFASEAPHGDRFFIPSLRPMFGFRDQGNVWARSAQPVAVNPVFVMG